MRDFDIRQALQCTVLAQHKSEPDTLVVPEMRILAGLARIDVAVVNGEIHGFEIKSDVDKLIRLPSQISAYNRIFDRVTIITGSRHFENARKLVPNWWNIWLAKRVGCHIELEAVRNGESNLSVDSYAVAQLLWREEALDLLSRLGLSRGICGKPRRALWARLAESVPPESLRAEVRKILKLRTDWRSGES
jgi:hypothetical protein